MENLDKKDNSLKNESEDEMEYIIQNQESPQPGNSHPSVMMPSGLKPQKSRIARMGKSIFGKGKSIMGLGKSRAQFGGESQRRDEEDVFAGVNPDETCWRLCFVGLGNKSTARDFYNAYGTTCFILAAATIIGLISLCSIYMMNANEQGESLWLDKVDGDHIFKDILSVEVGDVPEPGLDGAGMFRNEKLAEGDLPYKRPTVDYRKQEECAGDYDGNFPLSFKGIAAAAKLSGWDEAQSISRYQSVFYKAYTSKKVHPDVYNRTLVLERGEGDKDYTYNKYCIDKDRPYPKFCNAFDDFYGTSEDEKFENCYWNNYLKDNFKGLEMECLCDSLDECLRARSSVSRAKRRDPVLTRVKRIVQLKDGAKNEYIYASRKKYPYHITSQDDANQGAFEFTDGYKHNANQKDYPWSVQIRSAHYFNEKDNPKEMMLGGIFGIKRLYFTKIVCSGSIIRKTWVITSSECLRRLGSNIFVDNLSVVAGQSKLDEVAKNARNSCPSCPVNDDVQVIGIDTILLRVVGDLDIGLVKLKKSLEFSEHVAPICLPTMAMDNDREQLLLKHLPVEADFDTIAGPSKKYYMAGWGEHFPTDAGEDLIPESRNNINQKEISLDNLEACTAREGWKCFGVTKDAYGRNARPCGADAGAGAVFAGDDGRYYLGGVMRDEHTEAAEDATWCINSPGKLNLEMTNLFTENADGFIVSTMLHFDIEALGKEKLQ